MSQALDDLLRILDLEPIEENIFRGTSPAEQRQQIFGGQVAGQALVAAGRTVERGTVHSLHAYFLRPGDIRVPILFEVDRIRDGRSFTTRRVVAVQHGKAIFNLSASFHVEEPGIEHQLDMPANLPDPESLPTVAEMVEPHRERLGELGEWWLRRRPIDVRYVEPEVPAPLRDGVKAQYQRVWIKADGPLPDDPLLHACVVAYASDMTLLDTTVLPHGMTWGKGLLMGASLDHAMWFHRPFRADEWLLYDQDTPAAYGARAFARGSIFSSDGRLVVSVAQEGLVRTRRQEDPGGGAAA
ncbi:MAG TPA: acyl-CoA thioesterase II [Candidatus Angelobacter sp.]|jgi:acyl-CoA thioesterase-2|nr:acyl-CoA thioesterase II [Candidatus Angelobacter sp.]